MHSWGGWLAGIAFIVALNLGANLIAQKITTLQHDRTGPWMPYRILVIGCLFALLAVCALVLIVLDAAGYRL